MKTIGEVYAFYKKTLISELIKIDRRRISVLLGIGITAIITVILDVFFLKLGVININLIWIVTLTGAGIITFIRWGYKANYKENIIASLALFMDDTFMYIPSGKVDVFSIAKSGLFDFNDAYGKDLIKGKVQNIEFEFSGLKLLKNINKDSQITVFKGTFFSADFNKNFIGETYVLPDIAEKSLDIVGKWMQSMNRSNGELVKLEDPEFEKMFVVYGTNQIEARYILTPALMRKIIDFARKVDKKLCISFVDSKINIAVINEKGLFETNIFKSVVNFEDIQKYYENFKFVLDIVDEFSLNTQIWQN